MNYVISIWFWAELLKIRSFVPIIEFGDEKLVQKHISFLFIEITSFFVVKSFCTKIEFASTIFATNDDNKVDVIYSRHSFKCS